jgi:hypothetical protein
VTVASSTGLKRVAWSKTYELRSKSGGEKLFGKTSLSPAVESVGDSSDLEAAANERPGLHHVQRLNIPHSNVSTVKLALPSCSCCAYTGSILVMPPKEFIIPRPCLRPWHHLPRRHSLFGRQWRLWARTGRVMPCPNKATPP